MLGAAALTALLPARAGGGTGSRPGSLGAQLAALTPAAERAAAARLLAALRPIDARSASGLRQRVHALSSRLLGARFAWNPTGEGAGAFDADAPLVLGRFDCLTFVETVLALARAHDLDEAFDDLAVLRYGGAEPQFTNRLHFVSVDWLPALAAAGLAEDALAEHVPAARALGHHDLLTLDVSIDKPAWASRLGANPMYRAALARATVAERGRLAAWAAATQPLEARLRCLRAEHLPTALAGALGDAADACIAGIVRPGTPFAQRAGGGDPITHCGWLLRVAPRGPWVLRGPALAAGAVVDRPIAGLLRGGGGLAPALGVVLWRVLPRAG
jgi:hypothetical protein